MPICPHVRAARAILGSLVIAMMWWSAPPAPDPGIGAGGGGGDAEVVRDAVERLQDLAAKSDWRLVQRKFGGLLKEHSPSELAPFRDSLLHLHREMSFQCEHPWPGLDELFSGKAKYDARRNELSVEYEDDDYLASPDFETVTLGGHLARVFTVVFDQTATLHIEGRAPKREQHHRPRLFSHVVGDQHVEVRSVWFHQRGHVVARKGDRTSDVTRNVLNTAFRLFNGRSYDAKIDVSRDRDEDVELDRVNVSLNGKGQFRAFSPPADFQRRGRLGFCDFPPRVTKITVSGQPDGNWLQEFQAQWEAEQRTEFDAGYEPPSALTGP